MGRRKEEEETTWEDICHMINNNAREILGETSGGMYVERESWWWNDDVQKAVKEKRDSFKKWQSSRTTEDLADYKENKTNAKKVISITCLSLSSTSLSYSFIPWHINFIPL